MVETATSPEKYCGSVQRLVKVMVYQGNNFVGANI